jgi:hypothetical protein
VLLELGRALSSNAGYDTIWGKMDAIGERGHAEPERGAWESRGCPTNLVVKPPLLHTSIKAVIGYESA